MSFVFGLVAALTFSLVTPMHITVTCTAPNMTASVENDNTKSELISIPHVATADEIKEIYIYASDLAVKLDQPIYVSHK